MNGKNGPDLYPFGFSQARTKNPFVKERTKTEQEPHGRGSTAALPFDFSRSNLLFPIKLVKRNLPVFHHDRPLLA
jgi:hypothetical protein